MKMSCSSSETIFLGKGREKDVSGSVFGPSRGAGGADPAGGADQELPSLFCDGEFRSWGKKKAVDSLFGLWKMRFLMERKELLSAPKLNIPVTTPGASGCSSLLWLETSPTRRSPWTEGTEGKISAVPAPCSGCTLPGDTRVPKFELPTGNRPKQSENCCGSPNNHGSR